MTTIGGGQSFVIQANPAPTADVSFTLTAPGFATLTASQQVLSGETASAAISITGSGSSAQTGQVTFSAASTTDPQYAGLAIADVAVNMVLPGKRHCWPVCFASRVPRR